MLRRFSVWLATLWTGLFDTNQSPIRYLGRALILDLPVSIPLAILVGLAFPAKAPDFVNLSAVAMIALVCLVGPLVETLFMILIFAGLRLVTKGTVPLAIFSCLIWAVLHSLQVPAWGLGIFWPFLIFSICYLSWESRSRVHAFCMTALLHALHNLVPCVIMIASRSSGTE